jgi:hypothetical protein
VGDGLGWSSGEFDVIGCDTGARYRITHAIAMNVRQLDATGRTVRQWCFQPGGKLAVGDVLLAQKMHGAARACAGEFAPADSELFPRENGAGLSTARAANAL